MSSKQIVAMDLGAESGRAMLGQFDGARLELAEVHRFANGPVRMLDTLVWDVPRLWQEMKTGLAAAAKRAGPPASVGVDTWGVDFGFLGADGNLLGLPVCYRDSRTEGILDRAFKAMSKEEVYRRTGLQFMRFNSLFQLAALAEESGARSFDAYDQLLFVPDIFNYLLTGKRGAEYTIASTSQMLDARTKDWDRQLVGQFAIPARLLPPVIATGTVLGALLPSVVEETGAVDTRVVASAGHDTAAAVAAVPASGDDWCYISSGTWSLMGAEIPAPAITPKTMADNFTNEGGVAGTIRFLKNIMGLWLVQQCRRSLEKRGRDLDYSAMIALAAESPAFGPIVDPDCDAFLNPADMATAIQEVCERSGQAAPRSEGAMVRCCLESLALRYRLTLEQMEQALGRKLRVIHIVGGGSRNQLLCQMTADCCGRMVIAGPVEATAMGNCLVQAMGLGDLGSLGELRDVVRASSSTAQYEPAADSRWDDKFAQFRAMLKTDA